MIRRLVPAVVGCALAATSAVPASAAPLTAADQADSQVYAFALLAPDRVAASNLVARAVVVGGDSCPALEIRTATGAREIAMVQRRPGATTKGHFAAAISCSAPIPARAQRASVAGHPIPAGLPRKVDRVATFADTGCRVDVNVQHCSSPSRWPFHRLAAAVVRADADVAVHVGDYYYRETACPPDKRKYCGDSPRPPRGVPFVDTAEGWIQDFFVPAGPLFATTPILALRGNHEACSNAGNGFFLYLDTAPGSADTCAPVRSGGHLRAPVRVSRPWTVDLPLGAGKEVRVATVDSAYGFDVAVTSWRRTLSRLFAKARSAAAPAADAWLLTHRPVLGLTTRRHLQGPPRLWTPWTSLDQAAASRGRLGPYSMILSGHLHLSQMVQVPQAPPQFVAGAGGTLLDPRNGYVRPRYGALRGTDGKPMLRELPPYPRLEARWQRVAFGFALIAPAESGWTVTYRSPAGKAQGTCRVRITGANSRATC